MTLRTNTHLDFTLQGPPGQKSLNFIHLLQGFGSLKAQLWTLLFLSPLHFPATEHTRTELTARKRTNFPPSQILEKFYFQDGSMGTRDMEVKNGSLLESLYWQRISEVLTII